MVNLRAPYAPFVMAGEGKAGPGGGAGSCSSLPAKRGLVQVSSAWKGAASTTWSSPCR